MTDKTVSTHHNICGRTVRVLKTASGKVLFPALLLAALCAPAQADKMPHGSYRLDGKALIYREENASGYRTLTATEPAGGSEAPLSRITFYPPADGGGAFDVSFSSYEGPEISGRESTLMIHTHIPIAP